jgi:predicted esterase YcpF (UPF0227 family)
MILYLHGLDSSPNSHKARLLAARMAELGLGDCLSVPQLPHEPRRAIAVAEREVCRMGAGTTLVGSSLGGFYATFLAERMGLNAALINPAVDAPQLARQWLGRHENPYTQEEWVLTEEHVAQLENLDVGEIRHPERYLVLLETGDAVLSWQRAAEKFAGARLVIVEGGDHAFQSFPQYLDEILCFAGLLD